MSVDQEVSCEARVVALGCSVKKGGKEYCEGNGKSEDALEVEAVVVEGVRIVIEGRGEVEGVKEVAEDVGGGERDILILKRRERLILGAWV